MKDLRLLTAIAALITSHWAFAQNVQDSTLLIKEAVVMASKNLARGGTSSITIPAKMIKGTPILFGEPDILKTIQLMPGVQSGTEGLSGMYVRGGGSDENLILLDGIPVHCQGHLLGLFSPFQSEAAREAVIHKGAFPARFGGRVSSVLEINTSGPIPERTSGCLGVGALSDKFHIEGATAKGKIDYSVSGRGMHTFLLDRIMRTFKIPANYYFKDLHARITGRIDKQNSLSLSYLNSKDKLYYSEDKEMTSISWGTTLGAIKWRRTWRESLTSESSLAMSMYSLDNYWSMPGEDREGYRTGIKDGIAKSDWLLTSLPGHSLRFGFEAISRLFIPEGTAGHDSAIPGSTGYSQQTTRVTGHETAIYIEDSFKPVTWLSVGAGLRLSGSFSGNANRINPEPRIAVNIRAGKQTEAKIAYSRTTQHIHQLSSTIAVLPVDLTVPVTRSIGPVISDQFTAGLTRTSPAGWELSIEGYLKAMEGVLEYKDDVIFIDDFATWEEQVASGKGRSFGLETLVRKEYGKTSGWIAYTLSKSERRFPDGSIGGGIWFPARYDIRHSVSIVVSHEFGGGWDAGAVWNYSTGGAVTLPDKDGRMPRRGNLRLPPSHRLDLGVNHHKIRRHGERVWNIGVYNAYNRKNPNLVIPVTDDGEDGSGPLKTISFLPVIPSVSYTRVF